MTDKKKRPERRKPSGKSEPFKDLVKPNKGPTDWFFDKKQQDIPDGEQI